MQVRVVQLGPLKAVVADTLVIGIHFRIPSDAVLTYAAISIISTTYGTNVGSTITLYRTKDEGITTYPYPLKNGYCSRNWLRPQALIWQDRHKLDSDYEYTLELSAYNLTGADITIQGVCVYEIEERGRTP